MITNPHKITFGEMRESAVRDVLIYAAIIAAATISRPTRTAGPMMSGSPTWHAATLSLRRTDVPS